MSCPPPKPTLSEAIRQPLRVVATLAGVALLAIVALPEGPDLRFLAMVGGAIILVAAVLPLLTEFELDVLGQKAKGTIQNRETRLREVCARHVQALNSLGMLVGVGEDQLDRLVNESIENACRTWRGPVIDHAVRDHLVCETAHLLKISIYLGGPYRFPVVTKASASVHDASPLATLPPVERLALALAVYAEVTTGAAASMIELDVGEFERLLAHARGALSGPRGLR